MKNPALRVLLTGGGTGGHVTPALAIADSIKERHPNARFLYVGLKGKAEEELVTRAGIPLAFVRSAGYPGNSNPLKLALFVLTLALGIIKALFILLRFRPDIIIATGGYVAAPTIFAAGALRKVGLIDSKIFLHEQNAVLGKLNKVASRFAEKIGVSFPESLEGLDRTKACYVGYPVRRSAFGTDRLKARKKLGLPEDAKVLFAFGGSQGARTINRAVVQALPILLQRKDVYVIHGTGKRLKGAGYDGSKDTKELLSRLGRVPGIEQRYSNQDFFHDIGVYYAASDLVICRAGAGTLTEICACGVPAIVIPKANLPGDHQVVNARTLELRGAAKVLYEGVDLSSNEAIESVPGEELAGLALELLDSPKDLALMSRAAKESFDSNTLDRIADLVDYMVGLGSEPDLPAVEAKPKDRVLGQSSDELEKLLVRIKAGQAKPLAPAEERLLHYKIDGYLASQSYVLRARGCRLAGRAGYVRRLPVLLEFAAGRKADGKFGQSPIVRRDAFFGIGLLARLEPGVLEAIEAGFSDPYYEARASAANAAASLGRTNPGALSDLATGLEGLLADKSFEVKVEALLALGEISDKTDLYERAASLYFDPSWKVRKALLDCYARLVQRNVMDKDIARREMDKVLITSYGFVADYPLKQSYNALRNLLEREGPGQEV